MDTTHADASMSIVQSTGQRWWELFSRRQSAEHQTLRMQLRGETANGPTPDGDHAPPPDPQRVEDLALRILATHIACGWAHAWPAAAREQLLAPLGLTSHHVRAATGTNPETYPAGVIAALLRDAAGRPLVAPAGLADPAFAEAMRRATDALPLALPTEMLLCQGGDDRIIPDPQTGLNRYGCRPVPTPGVAGFGSCSANSPSPRAFNAAEACRQRMLLTAVRAGDAAAAAEHAAADVRRRLRAVLQLDDAADCDIVLTPSGTDAEYLCTLIGLGDGEAPLLNLVVAPREIGSGSCLAAAGEHISNLVPAGCHSTKGAPLAGFPNDKLTVESVGVRDADGQPRSRADLEAELAGRIRRAVDADARVLLHLVDSSKTGLTRPSLAFAEAMLARHGDRLRVVADAAQGRFEPDTLKRYLDAGCMVILSGSKFYAGPSFSGAVLVPTRGGVGQPTLDPPRGLGEYLTRADLPTHWRRWRDALRRPANPAMLMRWAGALAEMQAYHAIDPQARDAARTRLIRTIGDRLAAHPALRLQAPTVGEAEASPDAPPPSIFTFALRAADGRPLGYAAARAAYQAMSRHAADDLPAAAPAAARRAAGRLFNMGQPLSFGDAKYGAFRVAVSAPMITRLAADAPSEATLTRRLDAEARHLDALLAKLAALAGVNA